MRLLKDEQLAQAVERHRDVLFEAIMTSAPTEFQDQAYEQLAKLRGMVVKEFKEYARSRIAALQDQRRHLNHSELDSTVGNSDLLAVRLAGRDEVAIEPT